MKVFLTAEAGEAEHAVNPLIPHPVEIVLSLVVFGLLYFAIKKFVVPNFERTFHDRTEAIEGGLKAAETKQAEADARLAQLEQQLGEAKHEAARIREEAREQGSQIVAEMRAQAQSEAGRIVEHGKAQIEAERQQAVTSLRTEVGSLATALAGRIVGESLEDDARSTRVVDRFLADLESSTDGAGVGAPTGASTGASTGAPAAAATSAPPATSTGSTGSTGSSALRPDGSSGEPR